MPKEGMMSDWKKVENRIEMSQGGEGPIWIERTFNNISIGVDRAGANSFRVLTKPQALDLAAILTGWAKNGKPLADCIPVDPRVERLARVRGLLKTDFLVSSQDHPIVTGLIEAERDRLRKELEA
jgi:hypothetical protein